MVHRSLTHISDALLFLPVWYADAGLSVGAQSGVAMLLTLSGDGSRVHAHFLNSPQILDGVLRSLMPSKGTELIPTPRMTDVSKGVQREGVSAFR